MAIIRLTTDEHPFSVKESIVEIVLAVADKHREGSDSLVCVTCESGEEMVFDVGVFAYVMGPAPEVPTTLRRAK